MNPSLPPVVKDVFPMGFIRSILRNLMADGLAVFAFVAVLALLWWGPK